jgi:hypothetical protein
VRERDGQSRGKSVEYVPAMSTPQRRYVVCSGCTLSMRPNCRLLPVAPGIQGVLRMKFAVELIATQENPKL